MLSVNNQRRPSVGTNVTPGMGVRRPSDGNVQPIINNMNNSPSSNGQTKSPPSTSPTLTRNTSLNGHFPMNEARSRSSSASSMQSSGSYLAQTDLPGVHSQLELLTNPSLQQQNVIPNEIDTDLAINEASYRRRHSPPSPISTNVSGSNVSSPTSAAAASLTRRDHITGHTHDRSRSASFDGEVEPSAWTLERVLEWLDDNSFSEYKANFSENKLYGEQFFALGNVKNIKNIVESGENRYRLINAIRKIGEIRPKRQSFSKGNQSDVQSPHSGGQLSSSNSINEQNSPTTPTLQSVPSPTEQKQKSLKLSTSFPELRNVNTKGPMTSPVIGPRTSSIGWENKSNNNSTIKEIDSSNENTINPPINNNNNNKWSSPHLQQSQYNFNNNPSVIQKQYQSNVSLPSEDASPLSPRRIKSSNPLRIARSVSQSEAIPDNGKNIFVGLPKNIQVTFDNKNFRVVDLSGQEAPSTIKDVIFSQLEIFQNERENFTFHLTEIGQKEIGPALNDETLIQKCKMADDRGTLKLLIKRKQLSDPNYGQSPSNLIPVGGDQPNKSKFPRRATPPEMSPPHPSSELNHPSPSNNEERFTGGFNPAISERWKASQPEGLSPLSEESQDTSKFVTFPVPHYSPDHKTPPYRPPNYSSYSNYRRPTSHDRENLISSSSQHSAGSADYSRNNAPLKSQQPLSKQITHPYALQPANGMTMKRYPSRENITRNSNPPPPPIPPKPNSVPQKSQQSLMPISGGIYNMHPLQKYSKSNPNLPLAQKTAVTSPEPERYQHTMHPVTSEPDLRHDIWQLFPEESDEPQLWPKIQSNKSSQNANDENIFWAEKPISIKNKDPSNEELKEPPNNNFNYIEPLRKPSDIEDGSTQKSSKNYSGGEENFWAEKPISSKKPIETVQSLPKNYSGGEEDFWAEKPISSKKPIEAVQNQSDKVKDSTVPDNGQKKNTETSDTNSGDYKGTQSSTPTPKRRTNSSGLARTVSMRRGVAVDESWVVRPTAEDLFEHLEQYFPDHDLDKPIIDANDSSVQQPSNNEEPKSSPTVPEKTGGKIQRGKSIRAAVREAREREQREKKERNDPNKKLSEIVSAIKVGNKLRRKPTTKLWDKKIVLVTSHKKSCPDVPPEDGVSAERKPVIWVKGELIGKGTFGKVFLAMNVNSSEIMAVKQIELPTTKSDLLNQRQQNLVKSFTDEMEILKDLDHDHIVQYIGFEKNNEAINIFLEYVNGGSIGTCLRIYGAFKEPVVRSFTRQILLGLQYLHNKGILHRDIKADNILVDEEGCCKISDFGISKKSSHTPAYDHNSNMSLQGTIFWMAPEVFTSSKGYSAKVDIWSLGCVVLEMFAGERPWSNLTDLAAMFKLGSEKKAPPIRENIKMSSEARNFLDQCFIIEPDERPTAKQLLQHSFAQEDPNFHFKEYISIPGH